MLNLSQEEKKVFLFLAAIALLGLGSKFLCKSIFGSKSIDSFSEEMAKVDLNKADKKTLMGVKGIGAKLSQRIIDYRRQHGYFSSVEELKEIKGMTEKKFIRLKDYFLAR
jgi:competence protein ComEA